MSLHGPEPWTLNPEPWTLNPQPPTLNPKPCSLDQRRVCFGVIDVIDVVNEVFGHFGWAQIDDWVFCPRRKNKKETLETLRIKLQIYQDKLETETENRVVTLKEENTKCVVHLYIKTLKLWLYSCKLKIFSRKLATICLKFFPHNFRLYFQNLKNIPVQTSAAKWGNFIWTFKWFVVFFTRCFLSDTNY